MEEERELSEEFAVVVPWFNEEQIKEFLAEWRIDSLPDWLVLQQDTSREGCGATKNRGVDAAVARGADVVVILDDDCYPVFRPPSLERHARDHMEALTPQTVSLFEVVTSPPSRGSPYGGTAARLPVAASMGFWNGVGDYDAARQLSFKARPMTFRRQVIYGRWFPLSGMNLAFRPREWGEWARFVDVPRYDDIWMGWLWQKEAYRRGYCFNLDGPSVYHSRQSNAWRNLQVESEYAEASDSLWIKIATSPASTYEELAALLPPHRGGSDR